MSANIRAGFREIPACNFFRENPNLVVRVLSRFMTSATAVNQFPASALPEVAFLGRSNVGKSSVINSLLGTKIAKTSSTPGRTRSINFFEVRWPGKPRPEVVFADLPGYGYAQVPREVSSQWSAFVEPYLREREALALCLALIDLNVPPQESDKQLLEFLGSVDRPALIVGTKADKLSGNALRRALDGFKKAMPEARVLPYSARTGLGRDDLWSEIRSAIQGERREIAL
jgi:GTP-binding protein